MFYSVLMGKTTSHMSYINLCSRDAQIKQMLKKKKRKKNERENETKAHVLQSCSVVMICVFLLSAVFMKMFMRFRSQSLSLAVVYIYPVEPNLCDKVTVTDSILGEYMGDEKTSIY